MTHSHKKLKYSEPPHSKHLKPWLVNHKCNQNITFFI